MKKKLPQVFLLVLLVVLGIRSLLPLVHAGFPVTHDGEGHVARVANYAVAIRQGNIPPRMAPTFWDGYGYPVFNFHYPLLNILGAPLVLVGANPELAVKVILFFSWILLWVGLFLFTREVIQNTFAALVGLAVFMVSPYMYSLVYVRGSYGELLAMAACLWLLYFVEKRFTTKQSVTISSGIIISSALLLLAHNIYAVFLFPLAFGYAIYRGGKKQIKKVFLEFGLGFGLSAFFWIPALLEKKYIVFEEKFGSFYLEHFVNFKQLLSSTVTFGVSSGGDTDTLSYGIGVAGLVVLLAGLAYLAQTSIAQRKMEKRIPVLVVTAVIFIVLMLPVSLLLWKTVFILPYLQFPWRFLGPLSVILAVLAAQLWIHIKGFERVLIGLAVVIGSVYVLQWYWPTYEHNPRDFYLNYRQSTTLMDELRPKTFTLAPGTLSSQQPQVIGPGKVEIQKWRGVYRTYTVVADQKVTVVEPTMYFLGWKVWVNGKEVSLDVTNHQGQISYQLEPGTWQITSRMTQQTFARLTGNTITVVSLVAVVLLILPGLQLNKKILRYL